MISPSMPLLSLNVSSSCSNVSQPTKFEWMNTLGSPTVTLLYIYNLFCSVATGSVRNYLQWETTKGNPTQKNHVDGIGLAWTQDGHCSDDSQSSLRTDEQLFEVISCVVFAQCGQAIQHPAICQNLYMQHKMKARIMQNSLSNSLFLNVNKLPRNEESLSFMSLACSTIQKAYA